MAGGNSDIAYSPNWEGSLVYTDQQRRIIAYHEAGHAVAAAYAHLEITGKPYFVERIAVARGEGGIPTTTYDGRKGYCNGLCRLVSTVLGPDLRLGDKRPQSVRMARNNAVWSIAYFLAGPYAELQYLKSKEKFASRYTPDLGGRSTTDFDYAERLFEQIRAQPGRRISYEAIHSKARILVSDHWNTVTKLAETLVACDELFSSDVERVIGPLVDRNLNILAA
ncbi:hypothetical protein G6M85_13740 [Agrobacterium tumefaciens]|uniref:hypothetical protein n=1 Tax=Agrobacterium tumefaciens TaxID=358 RepID=UPI000DD918EA|nr:hypothetical protein [Agrobacterium tumefaciens]MBP2570267.1 hypothetical protein [Agrobacterium tumefaciens]NTE66669.1 hypothetical protein [Agrobacterium tumefaciens]